jgi:small-conductance mechanosensitive channel
MNLIGSYWDYVIFAIIVLVVAFIIGRILRYLIGRGVKGASLKLNIVDPTKYNFLKNAVEFVVYIIAFIVIFNAIPTLKDYGAALFAGAGVLAAIVGFASQSAFSNIISGIFIVIFRPISVGDRVKVGQLYQGDVEDITLRHTIIKDFENRRIVIPNSVMNSETIVNSTIEDEKVCMFIEVGITLDSNIDLAMQIMAEECEAHPKNIDNRNDQEIKSNDPVVDVKLISFQESAQQLRAYAWARTASEGFDMKCDLLKTIKSRFDKAGIQIAYPRHAVFIKEQPREKTS